jgi:hypothetical protein
MNRRHNFQTVAWFYDLFTRDAIDMDPPYQRRSVWNQAFKDYFVDTVLLDYPAPAVFLYEDISPEGRSLYHVVDGKQRLTTLFEFVSNQFPVGEASDLTQHRGKFFSSLDDGSKKAFWAYQFLVEYVPSSDDKLINTVFDRINRNVSKLSPQELRHARLDGEFITTAGSLASWIAEELPANFPRIAAQARRQMKDVELVATLLLLLEEGPGSYSQEELDSAFVTRDPAWDQKSRIEGQFRNVVGTIKALTTIVPQGADIVASRLHNQADFYSLFGAIASTKNLPDTPQLATRLLAFLEHVEDEPARKADTRLAAYYDAARSASSDKGPRETRINYIKEIILGSQP